MVTTFKYIKIDGPSLYTGELLKILAKNDVKAAFHVKVEYLNNPVILAYLRSAINDRHIVGLRLNNDDIRGDPKAVKASIEEKLQRISKVTNGYKVKFVRFPYIDSGVPDPIYKVVVEEMGLIPTNFNLDSRDYTGNLGENAVVTVYKEFIDTIAPPAKGSFIAVQRDIINESVKQTGEVIKYLGEKGYKILRLDQCIGKRIDGGTGVPTGDGGSGNGADTRRPADSYASSIEFSSFFYLMTMLAIFYMFR
ncbi:hypothetical protein ROZALSC1DRAFT_27765 [Rozella allomycis CSF55]|uniref:Uncharacterized protein n=1 Tax=Rozella allomycis (strain CSF55) TaxID=988480 RepID=A0A4P9YP15_ROZAC|nr:hypothetical protein ROZALSC1DRAFT_27765 [Rozella allomycis CSF55]